MSKILIIGFGGTIAMVPGKNGLRPAKSVEELVKMVPSIQEKANITLLQLDNIDSTNANPTHWTKLASAVAQELDNYDAFIITHGTDTMAYTATALSFALGRGLNKPILFTGAQLPLVDFGTDARVNLERVVAAAVQASTEGIAEVMIVFDDVVLRGNRSLKVHEAKFKAFDSPAFPHLADITAVGARFSPLAQKPGGDKLELQPHFNPRIVSLEVVPGTNPDMIRAILNSGTCQGLLLKSLGAGNVPDLEGYSLIPVIREAVDMHIPVLIANKFVGGNVHMDIYELGKKAHDAGAISAGDMTDIAAQVKLMWALALQGYSSQEKLLRFMLKPIVGEISA